MFMQLFTTIGLHTAQMED